MGKACGVGKSADRTWKPMKNQISGKRKVLVVDDDPLVRAVFCRMVEFVGFEALRAETGLEALEMFKTHSDAIDIVFVDFIMPGMNGEEVMRSIRSIQEDARIVLSSGYHDSVIQSPVDSAEGKGFDAFLNKPFRLDELRSVIQYVLADGQ